MQSRILFEVVVGSNALQDLPQGHKPGTLNIATHGGRPIVITGDPVNGLVTFLNCVVNKLGKITIHADSTGTSITTSHTRSRCRTRQRS